MDPKGDGISESYVFVELPRSRLIFPKEMSEMQQRVLRTGSARAIGKVGLALVTTVAVASYATCIEAASKPKSPTSIEATCPLPKKGLRQGAANTDSEVTSFISDRSSYEMEIASAFAPVTANQATIYCLRYEAENRTSASAPNNGRIDVFYWPLAAMSVELFDTGPKSRWSLLSSGPSPRTPTPDSTDIYAFKNAHFTSTAYKLGATSAYMRKSVRIASSDASAILTLVAQDLPQVLPEDAQSPVGAQWDAGDSELTVTTDLDVSTPKNSIRISIDRSGEVGAVFAPFAKALSSVKTPEDIPKLLAEFKSSPVEFTEGHKTYANQVAEVNLKAADTRLYIVKQPITLVEKGGGRVCFLAATYSPVPIPQSFQTCDPKIVYGDQ
ncbi:hypothetical protein FHS26_004363 [Rhizobium pisi]|uniref:Uncharacterized protein n=1 Tax=Rhizobium pisi TaxID=574561 RepID=A0A7W5BPH9_9HYPH|nr:MULTISPECIES: hypothetical protein [Rhizobium]MBB3136606.1 hypothetical protein [Rhizobium pisi]MBY5494461.1 hypothetical protein [Rhizobium leguminosarum]TCA37978.1 hypothetical protein E0H72_26655 [Rhizobium leguminosarum bv. viciae]